MKKIQLLLIICIALIAKSSTMPIVVNYEINDTLIYKYTESRVKCCSRVIIFDKVVIDKIILGEDSTMYVFSVTESIDNFGGPDGIPESVTNYYDTLVYSNSLFDGFELSYDNDNVKTLTKNFKPRRPEISRDTSKVYKENLGLTRKVWFEDFASGYNYFYIDLIYAKIGCKIFGSRPVADIVTSFDDNKYISYISIQQNNLHIYNYDETKPAYLYDIQGNNLMQLNGQNFVDISNLKFGLYHLKYTSLNNVNETKKFIKE